MEEKGEKRVQRKCKRKKKKEKIVDEGMFIEKGRVKEYED